MLSSAGRKSYTTGEIVNLMAVDSQRMVDFLSVANFLYAGPLEMGIALYLLWRQLGIATLAGIIFMVLLLPTNGFIAAKMRQFGMKVMKMKDKRVKLMNEILSGIKVFKLYAWETSFKDEVVKHRANEVKFLNKQAYLGAGMSFTFISAPFFVSTLFYNSICI